MTGTAGAIGPQPQSIAEQVDVIPANIVTAAIKFFMMDSFPS